MWLAGWVHRDISAGNILWLKEDGNEGRGILSDLEYAKKPGDGPASSDPKTVSYTICLKLLLSHHLPQGTPFFMALEIMERRLLCDESTAVEDLTLDNMNSNVFKSRSALLPRHHVAHDYLHDVESLCWVHLWTLLSRIPQSPSQMLANNIFQNSGSASPSRRELFLNGIRVPDLDNFHPATHDLAILWNSTHGTLLKVFRLTPNDRDNSMYAAVYLSLYVLCQQSSECQDAPNFPSARRLNHLMVPPFTPQNCSQCPADDEDYVPSKDESNSRDLGVEKNTTWEEEPARRSSFLCPSTSEEEAEWPWLLVAWA